MVLEMFADCCSTTTVTLAILAILTFLYFLATKRPKNFPPGPIGMPILGSFPFLGDNVAESLRKMKYKYGPVMSIQLGREDWVILNDYSSINEAFVRQSGKFSGRPKNFMFNLWTDGCGWITADYGNDYKILKKFGVQTLRGFGVGKAGIEENTIEEFSLLIETLSAETSTPLLKKVFLAASNIICRHAIGSRLPYDDKTLNTMMDVVREIFSDSYTAKMFGLFMAVPELRYIPPFNRGLKYILKKRDTFRNVAREIIEEHQETYDENNIRDVIDAFIKEKKSRGENDSVFFANQILQLLRDLFEAGTGTASTFIMWSIFCFATYPTYQEKIFDEIEEVVGNNTTPQMRHRHEMPYTCAFIQELMRLKTLVPLGVFHKTNAEATINGYTIPKNTTVSANLWAVHHDPDFFENPEEFRPERFLDEDGMFIKSNHVIPFSIGLRKCLGNQIAKTEVFIFVTNVIQKLKIVPRPSIPLPSFGQSVYNMLTYEPPTFEVDFVKR